ncbi:MAG: sugar transferase, partial [Chitinophagaceae bacterium]
NIPMIGLNDTPLDNVNNQIKKRLFDILFSSLILIFILSWLIPIVAILIKLSSEGPVFFRQKRTGLRNKEFRIYKFRTMRLNEVSDTLLATKTDSRITKIGKILRKTSIDEMPQFINVFLGDMSVVGPRPFMIGDNQKYGDKINKFITRHSVKPGITSMASLKFRTGTNIHIMQGKIRLDRFYIYNWSFSLDIKIIINTIYAMLFKRDAY